MVIFTIIANHLKVDGRQLVSMALPPGLNVNMKNGSHNDSETDKLNHVIIKDGQLIQGRLDIRL